MSRCHRSSRAARRMARGCCSRTCSTPRSSPRCTPRMPRSKPRPNRRELSAMIRDATLHDVPRLVEFVVAEAREAQALELEPAMVHASVTAMFDDRTLGRYWVCERDGDVVGAIAVVREWSDWRNASYWW